MRNKILILLFSLICISLSAIAYKKISRNKVSERFTSEISKETTNSTQSKSSPFYEQHENARIYIPNFNYTDKQADIHLLQFRKEQSQDSYNVMIDVAFTDQANERLITWLKSHQIKKIDEIFITHPHQDHYGGLWTLINSKFPIKKIWMNIPNKDICDKEIPWGCNYKEIQELIAAIKDLGIEIQPLILNSVNTPQTLYQDRFNKLELLYASSPINPILGSMDINDLSMIMKLTTNDSSYLFTGDLNKPLSGYLTLNENNLKVDILKAPHHGTESVAVNEFLDKVDAQYAIVPSPQKLWCSERSKRYREYFAEHKMKTYISGFHGDMVIRHFDNRKPIFDIQNPSPSICR